MKFFQKRWVAGIICLLMIVAAFGISANKQEKAVYQPSNSEAAEDWGEENYQAYTRYVLDEAGLFSEKTIREVSEYNAEFDYAYGSICGIATVSSLDGQSIEDAAYDTAERIGLGEHDYLLLLDEQSKDWYFVYGDAAAAYVDHRLEILVTGAMDTILRNPNEDLTELFDDLEDWCSDTLPLAASQGANSQSGGTAIGTGLFVLLIVVLVIVSLASATIRAGRRIVGGWWPMFIGRPRRVRFHHHTPPPGHRPPTGPRPGTGPKMSSGGSRSGGFGGSSRGSFGRGGGFGGSSRGGRGGFGGKR